MPYQLCRFTLLLRPARCLPRRRRLSLRFLACPRGGHGARARARETPHSARAEHAETRVDAKAMRQSYTRTRWRAAPETRTRVLPRGVVARRPLPVRIFMFLTLPLRLLPAWMVWFSLVRFSCLRNYPRRRAPLLLRRPRNSTSLPKSCTVCERGPAQEGRGSVVSRVEFCHNSRARGCRLRAVRLRP